jgi:hypothetical protein
MPDRPSYPGAPRWVTISGIIAVILAMLVALVIFTGLGGPHGPGRHMSFGEAGSLLFGEAAPGINS